MTERSTTERRAVEQLARLYGVQTAHYDVDRRLRRASTETLLSVSGMLGAQLDHGANIHDAIRGRRQELVRHVVEPVTVAWDGHAVLSLRLPSKDAVSSFSCESVAEDGARQTWTGTLHDLPAVRQRTVESVSYVTRRLAVPITLTNGYHELTIEVCGQSARSLIISAPQVAYCDALPERARHWGVFLPLYALHRESSWGGGDFSDLQALMEWAHGLGASLVATLPLLSWQSEVSDDPSPYSPSTKLFWNEIFLDIAAIPELAGCAPARQLLGSAKMQREIEELRHAPTVDYLRQMELKRRVLRVLAEWMFEQSPHRRAALDRFREQLPDLDDFARFRAVGERRREVWPLWPERLRQGDIQTGDYNPHDLRYHQYVQWQVHEQLQKLSADARARDMLWYLDFPLGANGAGYDVWREQDLFAREASGGAPPDAFFTQGQNWGFPPLHPERLRDQGYRYLIKSLRRHLQYAQLLRIDHAMGLHRLYWVPHGMEARDGAYVRYRSDELFALLIVESHRHRAQIVGENLGTVPHAVNAAMLRHGLHDMYVVQYEARRSRRPVLPAMPRRTVASLNTHDMPPFASYWTGLDIDDRADLGLMSTEEAGCERENRADLRNQLLAFLRNQDCLDSVSHGVHEVHRAFLEWLASSNAEIVLVTLEDLWEETQPQNTPGTYRERCNWRRKTRYTLEQIAELPQVIDTLRAVEAARRSDAASTSQAPETVT